MTPKERRDILFKKSRPFLRPLEILNGEGYSQDLKTLYVAHKHKPFLGLPEGIEPTDFMAALEQWSSQVPFLVSEDMSPAFEQGGIVAIGTMAFDGWKLEPHVEFMPWASARNKLTTAVAFFQKLRYDSDVGICIIHARGQTLFDHAARYFPPGFIRKVGKIPHGFPDEDDYLYSVRGKKHGRCIQRVGQ